MADTVTLLTSIDTKVNHSLSFTPKRTMKFFQPNEYQSRITGVYEKVAAEVLRLLPSTRVEHIGSSAIPGAISKGDLDVFVGVDKVEFNRSIQALERNGYRIKSDTLRNESLCMLEIDEYEVPVALQVVENGSEFEMFLTFRDAVRRNEDLLREYNQLKLSCTDASETCYRERKRAFIENVLAS